MMAVRMDPWNNIVGVGWRDDETETEGGDYPRPEYFARFISGKRQQQVLDSNILQEQTGYHPGSWAVGPQLGSLLEDVAMVNDRGVPVVFLSSLFCRRLLNTGGIGAIEPASSLYATFSGVSGISNVRQYIEGRVVVANGQPISSPIGMDVPFPNWNLPPAGPQIGNVGGFSTGGYRIELNGAPSPFLFDFGSGTVWDLWIADPQ